MKISIAGSRGYPYVYSGFETFVKELSERLVQSGHDITVYCHRNLFKTRPKIVNNIHLVYIPTIEKKILSQFVHSSQAMIHACIRKNDIILVVNPANGPFGVIAKIFRKRTALNVDGVEWMRPKWKGFGQKYFYWASKMATRFYDEIITDSVEMQKIYKKEFNCHSTYIAYGADIEEPINHGCIKKWDLREFEYYLIVGRLIPDNNVDVIIREFAKTNSQRKLVVVGDVPYKDYFAQRAKASDDSRIIFTGYIRDQNELGDLYNNCYAYFHGHEFGGTNPSLLKALAHSCAVYSLDTVFNREVLKNGEYGIFFSKIPDDLKNVIQQMENHPERLKELREKAKQRIRENYTWEKITEQYEELFRKMTGDS